MNFYVLYRHAGNYNVEEEFEGTLHVFNQYWVRLSITTLKFLFFQVATYILCSVHKCSDI